MNDNENKTNAPIKLPVRYDADAKFIRGDDQRWVCDCDNPVIANQIVAALNASRPSDMDYVSEKEDAYNKGLAFGRNEADALRAERDDLAMFVRRFVNSRFVSPCPVKEQAQDYLNRKGLAGSILRDAAIKPNAAAGQSLRCEQ